MVWTRACVLGYNMHNSITYNYTNNYQQLHQLCYHYALWIMCITIRIYGSAIYVYKRYRHQVYMLGNISCKQCTVAHTQQGLLAIVYHTYSRAYLRGTVVHKYMPISLQLYMMSEGDLVYSLHLTQLQSIVVHHTLQKYYGTNNDIVLPLLDQLPNI